MFKTENFREHYWKLFKNYVIFVLLAFAIMVLSVGFKDYQLISYSLLCLSCVIFIIPFLMCQGYFWELTDEIISRDYDITASEVYNGKISQIFKITLPRWDLKRFIWRGVASIVATMILFVPMIAMFVFGAILGTIPAYEVYSIPIFSIYSFNITPMILLCLMTYLIIPALLWNYAKRNSIIAVLNLRAGIYLMGNYAGRYFFNSFCFIVYYFIDYLIMALLVKLFFGNGILAAQDNILGLILFGAFSLIWVLKYLYTIFVSAYLLGTISDPGDGLV
jgi:hypothetical protein